MAKLFVSGYADWWANEPHIVLSVEADTGKPVTDLNEKNFTVGTLGSGAQYGNVDVTSQFDGAGSADCASAASALSTRWWACRIGLKRLAAMSCGAMLITAPP